MNFTILITACFHALFLLVPFVFTWTNSELFELNKMLVVYGFTSVIGALWLMRCVVEKRLIWQKQPAVLLALLFLAGQAAATLFSIHFRTSLLGFYSRLNGGLLSSLSYTLLFLALINNVPKKQALSLLLTSTVAVLLASLYAIPEHFGASPSCYLMKQQWVVDCWKQDVQERVFGTFGQPNWLAAYIVGLAPVVWLFAQKSKAAVQKFWFGVLGVLLLALWFTKSRSGQIGLASVGLIWLTLKTQVLWQTKLQFALKSRWSKLVLGLLSLGFIVASGIALSRSVPVNNVEESFDLSQGSESGSIRLIVWRGALKVWQRYPWFGSGPGTFAYSYYQDRPVEHNSVSEWEHLYNKAHNEFLNYLAETGLVGLATYLSFLLGLSWLLIQRLPKKNAAASVPAAALMSIVGLSVTHFFGFSTVTSNLLLFLLPALVFLGDSQAGDQSTPLRGWRLGMVALVGLLTFSLLNQVAKSWQADRWYAEGKRQQQKLEYSQAASSLQKAVELVPTEAYYYDELANLYSKVALTYALAEDATSSTQVGEAAIQSSNLALSLNPRHLSFYKTRARVFLILAQIDKQYLAEAEKVLQAALALSPTDAQLWYNLGLVQHEAGQLEIALQTLQYTVEIKPNYVRARSELGDLLVELGQLEAAKDQYRFILDKLSPTDTEIQTKLNELENPQSN